jgi:hypothetical protein
MENVVVLQDALPTRIFWWLAVTALIVVTYVQAGWVGAGSIVVLAFSLYEAISYRRQGRR